MLYGHYDKETGKGQTLLAHLQGVSKIAGATAAALGLSKTAELIAMLHDMGKASVKFQNRLLYDGPKCNHASCGAQFLAKTFACNNGFDHAFQCLVNGAICGHHSGLPDYLAPDGEDIYQKRVFPEADIAYEETVAAYLKECFSEDEITKQYEMAKIEFENYLKKMLQAILVQESDNTKILEIRQFFLSLTARYLYSALIDADRYDTYCWQIDKEVEIKDYVPVWKEAAVFLENSLKELTQNCQEKKDMLNEEIINIRQDISDQCAAFATHGPGIYQLNVPTGAGKTLSVLRYALHIAEKENDSKILYVAPYKTILEQNANEIRDKLPKDISVLEHHSDVIIEEKDYQEELKKYQLATSRWEEDDVILTTMVQFLQVLFIKKSSAARRFRSLANAVIILDEIQSLPAKFVFMLNAGLNFLNKVCGCTIILCTATQPKLASVDVPVWLGNPKDMVDESLQRAAVFNRTMIVDKSSEPAMNGVEIARFCMEQQQSGNSVLAIFNTKKAAKEVYTTLKDTAYKDKLFFITTSLCPAHRMDIIKAMRTALDKKEKIICISTQLIEAGIDISFDCVIRSLAGLDSIVQAAGRCNRHGKAENPKPVYIIKSDDENVESLEDIRLAQEAMVSVLENFKNNPEEFDYNLFSVKANDAYYEKYYERRAHELAYAVGPKYSEALLEETTIYSLLTRNSPAIKALQEEGKEPPRKGAMNQALDTAAGLVKVIESNTYDVLVPYVEGKTYINELCGACTLEELSQLRRKVQRYMVSLFQYEYEALMKKGAIHMAGESGVSYLDQRFYNDTLGVVLEKGQ